MPAPQERFILAQAHNECGTSTPRGIGVYVSSQNNGFTLTPNPANESVDVQIGNEGMYSAETLAQPDSIYSEFLRSEYYEVTISNSFGLQIYSDIKYSRRFTIPTGYLAEGIYLVELRTRKAIFQQKLIIKH